MNGRSKIRNKAIAEVFSRMELIEGWGTGIRRIIKRAEEYQLRTPEFTEIGDTFRVNLFRKEGKKPIKADKNRNYFYRHFFILILYPHIIFIK